MTKRHQEHSGITVGRTYVNSLGRKLVVLDIVEYSPNRVDVHYRYKGQERVGSRPISATASWEERS